jgi:hypothetical protein
MTQMFKKLRTVIYYAADIDKAKHGIKTLQVLIPILTGRFMFGNVTMNAEARRY